MGVGGAFYTRAVIQDRDVLPGLRLVGVYISGFSVS